MASSEAGDARFAHVIGVDGMSPEEKAATLAALRSVHQAQETFLASLTAAGIGPERRRAVWSRIIAALAEAVMQGEGDAQ
jgi:hypothetical protein